MAGYNHLTMLGNLTRDPQLRYTEHKTAVVDVGLAVNRKWKGADGQPREKVCFIECRAFGSLAESISKYQAKGALILLDGHLDYETWEKHGEKKSRHRLMIENAQFMPNGQHNAESEDGKARRSR